jgi:hypothetical protein
VVQDRSRQERVASLNRTPLSRSAYRSPGKTGNERRVVKMTRLTLGDIERPNTAGECWLLSRGLCFRTDELDPSCRSRAIIKLTFLLERKLAFRVKPERRSRPYSGEFQMPRFYFHKHLNGQTVPDRRGTSLRNENEACARAVRRTPPALRKSVSSVRNTYLAWEVSDGERTIYVVRGKVVIEKC